MREPDCTVMLISLKAGGAGLNLTSASQVFLLDPWWSPAVEDQACDRVHRLGQERPVTIIRYVVKDTVEVGCDSCLLPRSLRLDMWAHN